MFTTLARKIFGTANERTIKAMQRDVDKINTLESQFEALSDQELQAKTAEFKQRLSQSDSLDDLLHEAFAAVREASKRVLEMRPYDVQLVGGMVLHQGQISEMKTGEGKTLVATLAVYLNALTGDGVHVVTVNDYLAQRDAAWMGKLYNFLGLSVGVIISGMEDEDRQKAYACDVTYGTNNELGFDYLRDNMKFRPEARVQRPFTYAIVDEVDSILIDEARTPLIISGPAETSSDLYVKVDRVIPRLIEKDYDKDEKHRSIHLTEEGVEHVEEILRDMGMMQEGTLYDLGNVDLLHHVNSALRAHHLFEKDKDYIVKDNQVVIIDEFTGRMMDGRRYSDGLHQAIEAKEKVAIQLENQTLASITFQNYFRMYDKLAGMTGTAMTEAGEFDEIYGLHVVDIPTNVPCVRQDENDEIYRTAEEKYDAIIELIRECRKKKQPVLVGTVSIEKSELISKFLKKAKIAHQVLNARYHDKEALIIEQAGQPGAVTIATNMAGRGTDIKLGGNLDMMLEEALAKISDPEKRAAKEKEVRQEHAKAKAEVLEAGGLYIVGTERHESRRIDDQLRGRAGRQGDPGYSKFFLSLEDDLMRIFGSERMDAILGRLGIERGESIYHPWINKAIEKAQSKVEIRNFEIRKQLLKFDDVMNDQRKVIFDQRLEVMQSDDISEMMEDLRLDVIEEMVAEYIPEKSYADDWDIDGLHEKIIEQFNLELPVKDWADEEGVAEVEIRERITEAATKLMKEKEQKFGPELMRAAEKQVVLHLLDQLWKDHLLSLDHLRQGIHLRAHGQRDPLNEYKREAFELFADMLRHLREKSVSLLARITIEAPPEEALKPKETQQVASHSKAPSISGYKEVDVPQQYQRPKIDPENPPAGWVFHDKLGYHVNPNDPQTWGRVPRNALCPCGSGKKYKQCHGSL